MKSAYVISVSLDSVIDAGRHRAHRCVDSISNGRHAGTVVAIGAQVAKEKGKDELESSCEVGRTTVEARPEDSLAWLGALAELHDDDEPESLRRSPSHRYTG